MSTILFDSRAPGARMRLRAALLGSCCITALGLSGAASAQVLAGCPPGPMTDTPTCVIDGDGSVAGAQILYDAPNAGSDEGPGVSAGTYQLINNATNTWLSTPDQFAGLAVRLRGGMGSQTRGDAGAGGAGGVVDIQNNAVHASDSPENAEIEITHYFG